MKIGFLIYSLQGGGAERMVSRLVNYMSGKVDKVTLFLLNARESVYEVDPRIEMVVLESIESSNRMMRTVKRLQFIRQKIKEKDIDVLYAFTTTMYPYAALCSKGLKTKVIGAERANPHVYGKEMKLVIRFMSPLCDGFVFQTEGARGCYPRSIASRAAVISNAAPAVTKIREKRDDGILRFCTAGRLHTDKDYDTLFEAFALLVQSYPDSELVVLGDGELKEYYQEMCKRLKINDKVIFCGFTSNIYGELAQADIFVFSSKSEGMPNAILEAMAVGLPCLSTDCDYGPRELIRHGVNGMLCKVADPEDMAEKMRWFASHESEREAMGEAAKKVQDEYAEDKILGKYLRYAKKMMGK